MFFIVIDDIEYELESEMYQSINLLKRALEEVPDNGDIYYMLAQNYKIDNITSDYKYMLEMALENEDTLTTVTPEVVKQELSVFEQ